MTLRVNDFQNMACGGGASKYVVICLKNENSRSSLKQLNRTHHEDA